MNNDDHLDSDQLSPRIVAALRDVPVASNEQRDQHINAAMDHLVVRSSSPRNSWLSVAAASLLLLAGGVIIGRATTNSKSTNVAVASGTTPTTMVAKGDVGTSTTIVALCSDQVAGEYIGSYTSNGTRWLLVASGATLRIVNAATCSIASQIPLPTTP